MTSVSSVHYCVKSINTAVNPNPVHTLKTHGLHCRTGQTNTACVVCLMMTHLCHPGGVKTGVKTWLVVSLSTCHRGHSCGCFHYGPGAWTQGAWGGQAGSTQWPWHNVISVKFLFHSTTLWSLTQTLHSASFISFSKEIVVCCITDAWKNWRLNELSIWSLWTEYFLKNKVILIYLIFN